MGPEGRRRPERPRRDVAVVDDYARAAARPRTPTDLPLADVEAAAAFDAMPQHGDGAPPTSSIISEAAPSESADFTETRLQGADTGAAPLGTGLPLIGDAPGRRAAAHPAGDARRRPGRPGRARRSCRSRRPAAAAAQVAASGQALMQSQRLAKSVSQALIGSPTAFPEVKESADVLAEQRAQPEDRRRRRRRPRRRGVQDDARSGDAAGRPRREERRHRARAAEGADRGRPGAARDQPPVVRPARVAEAILVAQAAARHQPDRGLGARPAGDADAAHRQVGQRVPDHRRRQPRGRRSCSART